MDLFKFEANFVYEASLVYVGIKGQPWLHSEILLKRVGSGEKAWQLGALAALAKDLGLIPSTAWWLTTLCYCTFRGSYIS